MFRAAYGQARKRGVVEVPLPLFVLRHTNDGGVARCGSASSGSKKIVPIYLLAILPALSPCVAMVFTIPTLFPFKGIFSCRQKKYRSLMRLNLPFSFCFWCLCNFEGYTRRVERLLHDPLQ